MLSALVLVLLLVGGVMALADVRMYSCAPGAGCKVVAKGNGPNQTVVCTPGLSFCTNFDGCGDCHAALSTKQFPTVKGGRQVDSPMTKEEMEEHFKEFYPRVAVKLAPGEDVKFGDLKVLRERNRLVLVDGKRKHPLPADAVLLKDKEGDPALITYRGLEPPGSR